LRTGAGRSWLPLAAAILALLLAFAMSPAGAAGAADAAAVSRGIGGLLSNSADGKIGGEPIVLEPVRRIYAALAERPIWSFDPAAEAAGRLLLEALAAAPQQGLGTDELHLSQLNAPDASPAAAVLAQRDVLLTDAFIRYASRLRGGAVPVSALGRDWGIVGNAFDPGAALLAAIRGGRLADLLHSLPPADPGYGALIGALQRYRAIVARGGWPHVFGAGEIKLDQADPRLADLRRRLTLEQDLAPSAAGLDVEALRAAVRLFQARHGLEPDGRVGVRTLAELNVAAEQRVAQILANLERWRHLPHDRPARHIAVNVADASLDVVDSGRSLLQMRVIVGDRSHPTPSLAATIAAVTFNPPWNIPPSIAVKEMLPKLRRNPDYLADSNIVIRGREGDDPSGRQIDWRTVTSKNFPFRLQQLPGPKNSLGGIKFEMPNRFDVYLHDTPTKALFERSRRGFSHGCVRLQHAADLAVTLLADQSTWNAETIAAALADGTTRQVPLAQPIPVYLLYWTAFVDAEGRTNFRDDIYGRDPPIEAMLGGQNIAPAPLPQSVGCPVS